MAAGVCEAVCINVVIYDDEEVIADRMNRICVLRYSKEGHLASLYAS
jgi:hypothetical protein